MSSEGRPTHRSRLLLGGNTPRVAELDALLREVDELRLTLETDLSLAASAVEAGAPQLAVEILDSDRDALRAFEESALGSLAALAAPAPAATRRMRLTGHAAPAAAAAVLVAVLAGLMPQGTGARPGDITTSTVAASDSLARLQDLVAMGDEQQVRLASATLHEQLAGVVAQAKSDPFAAQQALLMLSYEQSAIVAHGGSDALADVLVRSRELAQAIRAALPKAVRSFAPAVPVDEQKPQPKSSAKPAATTAPKPSSSPKPSPKASSSSPAPTASPSSTKDTVLPEAPGIG